MGLKYSKEESQDGPRDDAIPSVPAKRQSVGRWMSKCEHGAHLYLPGGHVVRAVLHAAKDTVKV